VELLTAREQGKENGSGRRWIRTQTIGPIRGKANDPGNKEILTTGGGIAATIGITADAIGYCNGEGIILQRWIR